MHRKVETGRGPMYRGVETPRHPMNRGVVIVDLLMIQNSPKYWGVKTPQCPMYRGVETPQCPMYRGVFFCFLNLQAHAASFKATLIQKTVKF